MCKGLCVGMCVQRVILVFNIVTYTYRKYRTSIQNRTSIKKMKILLQIVPQCPAAVVF